MDKQKINAGQKNVNKKQTFPLLEAILLTPKEGKKGQIGICTNTSAPGEVINEISEENRKHTCVLGSLIVSRDGVERMIINTLAHPTLKYLVLFSEESVTFAPSTNLLQAMMNGFDEKREGNFIKDGVAASPHYPNLNDNLLQTFRNEIVVVPIFMHTNKNSKQIIEKYIEWLKPKINDQIYELLKKSLTKDKIYYDTLNKVIAEITKLPESRKNHVELDPKEFQQLQPPTIELENYTKQVPAPFRVSNEGEVIRLDIEVDGKSYFIRSKNDFLLAYSLMKFLGTKKNLLSPLQQLTLGAELGRISLEILNGKLAIKPFADKNSILGKEEIPIESNLQLKIDKKFYYRINSKDKQIRVLCMAFDVCAEFFELVSSEPMPILDRLVKEGRFDDYEMDILHRIDIGTQIGRAYIAAKFGYSFIQDLSIVFKVNKSKLPFLVVESDSFLDVHKTVLRQIYTNGITEEHGDSWKGLARTASVLAIYRNAEKALEKMPAIYKQGSEDTETMRTNYKKELLRKDHDGSYTYGERTRAFFGFDQIIESIKALKKNPSLATVIQRFDPSKDMSSYKEKGTGKIKFTHDPCLTHDIFFVQNGRLNSFHIARAHNTVNAYPENIFGLYDAYTTQVREALKLKSGDMYMLSNRANILLITEEQRTKKLMSEPSKPIAEVDTSSGPYLLEGKSGKVKNPEQENGVAYFTVKSEVVNKKPNSPILKKLENYRKQNIIEKAVNYLHDKGVMHNNPILTEYYAGTDNPQKDQLVFFQANVFGKKVYGTAVFANRSLKNKESDLKLCNYIMTKYSKKLKYPLGEITLIYVCFKK